MKIDVNDLRKVSGIGEKTIQRIIEELSPKKETVVREVKTFVPTMVGGINFIKGIP